MNAPAVNAELANAVTVLDHLIEHLRSRDVALDGQTRPAAILWTDPAAEWRPLVEVLQTRLEELLVLGEFAPDARTGPAIWIRCVVDGALSEPQLPEGRVPIIYMPGVGRQQLRAAEECPDALKPLVELMFRGAIWVQPNGNDWTASAFLTSPKILGLDIARDRATNDALRRALPEVALASIAQLTGRRVQADDFDRMLSEDVVRDILRWMGDASGTRARLGENGWGAFRNRCREELAFDPETEADVVAGERLGKAEGPWSAVWQRFAEAPTSYGDVPGVLRRSRPVNELPFERERWPDLNDQDEEEVRQALAALSRLGHGEACDAISRLEERHGARRGWVWAQLGLAPMARTLEHLARLAAAVRTSLGGTTPNDVADAYGQRGWQADAATWEALAASPGAHEAIVAAAVRHLAEPWLEDAARAFQAALERAPLAGAAGQQAVEAGDDVCLMFVDGLRFDLGKRLTERLEASGCSVNLDVRWAALPTVTATGKPAVTPVADAISGDTLGEDFTPRIGSTGRPAIAPNLRAAMAERGYQLLESGSFDTPLAHPARGWVEAGNIDSLGHSLGAAVARKLDGELDLLADRIRSLLDAGWEGVRVVTDHGWLLLPGGLPKVELPLHLTASRWARCAVIAGGATPDVTRAPWHWNSGQWFATAPGVACFKASEEYVHGGLSVQECLTPDLTVRRAAGAEPVASITSITWRGLRCFVEGHAQGGSVLADLRLERPSGPSVVVAHKPLDDDGSVSLVLAGDEHEEAALVLVLLDEGGSILTQRPTRVGAGS